MFSLIALTKTPTKTKSIPGEQEKQVPLSIAIENVELMLECSNKLLSM